MRKTYKISGMHCSSCVLRIEDKIKKLKKVRSASVDFKNKKLVVNGDFSEKDIRVAVKKLGYLLLDENEEDKSRISNKVRLVVLIFLLVLSVSFIPHPLLKFLNDSLLGYIKLIWWAVLIGLLIGGLIDYFIPEEFIFKYLGQRKKRTLFYSVLAGFLLSACSHGILAISMQLYKKGASVPSVVAFLLASPWANLPVTILLFGFFGVKALFFILGAMLIALITGFIYMGLDKLGWIESSREIELDRRVEWTRVKNFNLGESIKGVWSGIVSLSNMVLWWILIGFLIAGFIGAYVPEHFFMNYLGPNFLGLLLTLIFATIIEVCSEGSSPIAFEIFNKVGSFGNPFVFLMAGVVTDYTEIGLIWTNIGKKAAFWLPVITVPMVLFLGWLFNLLL